MLAGRFAAAAPRRGCLGSGAGGGALFGGIYPGDKRIVEKSLPQALFFLGKKKEWAKIFSFYPGSRSPEQSYSFRNPRISIELINCTLCCVCSHPLRISTFPKSYKREKWRQ